ncbi:Pre-rRNA-processing protein TSR1-like protein, partial [Smittium mucronatum]
AENFKQTFRLVELDRDFNRILETALLADYLVFIMSAVEEVDDFGNAILSAIQAQGYPSVIATVQHTDASSAITKNLSSVKKSLSSFMSFYFPSVNQIYSCESDVSQIIRYIANTIPAKIGWRDTRPYMIAESMSFLEEGPSSTGNLEIVATVRGNNLDPNRLIHIPGHGEYQVLLVSSYDSNPSTSTQDIDMDQDSVSGNILCVPDPEKIDSLVSSNVPDTTNEDQIWPEEEEMSTWKEKMAELEAKESEILAQRVRRVPKGTSSYQAAWILDDLEEPSDGYDSDDMSQDDNMSQDDQMSQDESDGEEYEEIRVDEQGNFIDPSKDADDDDELPSPQDLQSQLDDYLKLRAKQSNDEKEFPDEVDVPTDVPAHIRFSKYRGLQSLRTSPWDPYENLPLDYSRIFQLENPKNIMRNSMKALFDAPVSVGTKIRLVLKNVEKSVYDSFERDNSLFGLYGLMQYENKMTVVHFLVKRDSEYTEPIKSKDALVMRCGFRKFLVHPLYSQHTSTHKSSNNVHRFERYLQMDRVSVGSAYLPITFGNVPVSLFLPEPDSTTPKMTVIPTLIGTGSVFSVDPTRILAKRIVLTGVPYKINKKTATIRHMFYNPIDINYFKPIQLSTKYGRYGHIVDSLGTHGYMKCMFNGPIKGVDTICMNLYKRVFPKWNTIKL